MATIQSLTWLNQLVQILDTTTDWLQTTTWGTLNLTDATIAARERIFPSVLLTWRKCTCKKCCDGGFGKFSKIIEGKHIKQSTRRVWWCRQVKRWVNKWFFFSRLRRSWLRPTAEDVSAFGQHRKFPPHARKTSGTHGNALMNQWKRR